MRATVRADDIVTDILDRIALKIGLLPPADEHALEKEIRRDWGGENHYVAKRGECVRLERLDRDARICTDHRRGEAIPLLSRRYNLTEKRIRQIVARQGNDLP